MKFVPKAVTRLAGTAALKASKASPTVLVVTGIVGFGVTAVMAARATRNLDPVLEDHEKTRIAIDETALTKREEQKAVVQLYFNTAYDITKVYGPTVIVGALSAAAVLSGHKILMGRYVGAMAAYSSLWDQFGFYRQRVAESIGVERERDIYDGARLEYVEDPNHKGEFTLQSKFGELEDRDTYLRPWFDETNYNWKPDAVASYMFLRGVQSHLNDILQIKGHVFLNDVYDGLGMPRTRAGAVTGWLRNNPKGDGYIDFGFMTSQSPDAIDFRNEVPHSRVRLNFNIDGAIWDQI